MPDIGDYKDIPVIEVAVKVGDRVEKEQSLVTLESDKATMDVPSSAAGVVKEVKVKVGDTVSEGSVIVVVEAEGGAAAAPRRLLQQLQAEAAVGCRLPRRLRPHRPLRRPHSRKRPSIPAGEAARARASHASPSVRKFARELGVDVTQVPGTGPKGRITQADVTAFIKGVMTGQRRRRPRAAAPAAGGGELKLLPWPKVDFSKFGPFDPKPLSRIKKISGANLHRNWVMIPHVTNNDEADITELEALRVQLNKENEKAGVKITMLAFVIKRGRVGAEEIPDVQHASLDGDNLVFKQYYHVGFAADTPNGLVVPVIRDCGQEGPDRDREGNGGLCRRRRAKAS